VAAIDFGIISGEPAAKYSKVASDSLYPNISKDVSESLWPDLPEDAWRR
jgi:hypothetical protein